MSLSSKILASKILVVDDDEAILEAIQVSLELEEYRVCTASDGKSAIKTALSEKPDIIILDVLLSGSDGRDIARTLKKMHGTSHIPIIMVSAHSNVRESVVQAGADDFVAKPFDMNVLLEKVSRYTQK